ncbi:MAG: hypothetical protein LBQ04_00795 [Endomicrobium sp.]|jgi:hypothetical protein|nr:hypothetical protein [Endomicrobium sp.]
MKKLVLMSMLFLGAQCDAHPWDGSLTSPRIWENSNEFGWFYNFIRFIDLENILYSSFGGSFTALGEDDLI